VNRFATTPRRVEKPWGWELVWAEAEDYVGKLLFVRAGESLSLQYHEVKDESWLVQEGRARLELGDVGGELETASARGRCIA
jgi:mannose-6-phosphate isomerase-like protein (cupin superfamily)